jgi:hypothetical protein
VVDLAGAWRLTGAYFVAQDTGERLDLLGQVRFVNVHGDELSLRSAPIEHPAFPGQKAVAYVDWRRES